MRILYIYRNPDSGFSIGRVFTPIEVEVSKSHDVDSLFLPRSHAGLNDIIANVWYLKKYLNRNKKYDIIHVTGDVYYLALFLSSKNTVVTVHDIGFFTNNKLSFHKIIRYLFWIMPLRRVRFVTFISKKSQNEFNKVLRLRKEKQVVISNPVNADYVFSPKDLNNVEPNILHIGTQPNKNLSGVIKALSGTSCRLTIVGKLSDEHKKLLTQYRINYFNYYKISDEELLNLYKECDIVSFPSFYEGFGMPIIEAQSLGRPIVTSNIAPMNIIAGKKAILIDPYDVDDIKKGFETALTNYGIIVADGLNNAKQYTAPFISQKFVNLYREICNK